VRSPSLVVDLEGRRPRWTASRPGRVPLAMVSTAGIRDQRDEDWQGRVAPVDGVGEHQGGAAEIDGTVL